MTASTKNTATEATTGVTKKAAFATPDRDHHPNVVAPSSASSIQNEATPAGGEMQTVTPPTPNGKQVRFDKDNVNGVVSSKRGVVSRRGGRYGSPSRTSAPTTLMAAPAAPVEYNKAYRSPKREETSSDGGVPSLCSAHSEALGEAPSMISCSEGETTSPLTEMSPSKKPKPESRNVTFSPRPTEVASAEKASKKTPTRSPTNHHFHNLPSLRDAKLSSPCGIFLSPCPPSPSAYATIAGPPRTGFEEEKSSKAKSEERERALATPTDFAVDFGKGHQSSASFDASNVLAWLNSPQSPTAHGLFSPGGGLGSALNTPRTTRTPRTPTHTSFFFSDVASLPRNGEFASPKNKRPGMISISPLAPKRKFIQPRTMPMLGESPKMDAVQMAEQELLEDEDLSVLLQLASHSNTPRSKDGSDVFRSPRGRKVGYDRDSSDPALQLPIIGHNDGMSGTTKLSRKLSSRDDRSADDFAPPPLGIRSSSSGASREVFSRESGNEKHPLTKPSTKDSVKENDASEAQVRKKNSKSKKNRKGAPHVGYIMPPYPPRSDGPYYPMPAMPPGGSMRVVVGGPPPMNSRSGSKNSANSPPRHSGNSSGSPSRHPHYPMPPDGYGPGSMYPPPPHYHHPPPHMGVPYGHYPHPPPRHMAPMYPSSHPSAKNSAKGTNSKKSKGSKTTKAPVPAPKRPLQVVSDPSIDDKGTPSKKARKASPKAAAAAAAAAGASVAATSTTAPVKKKKSPTAASVVSADPMDRQKAAATIAAVNAASGGMNDRAAALAAAILRGVTMRPSGKWQAQLYYAGKSRYIGVFDTREKAALAYEIAREKLKSDNKTPADQSAQTLKATENAVNAARKAAFDGVNEKDPRVTGK